MIALATERVVFWTVVAIVWIVVGLVLAEGLGKRVFALAGVGAGALSLALGLFLIYCVDTDAKSVRRACESLANAVERNDVEGVVDQLDPRATKTRRLARSQMSLAKIERARISNFEILTINRATSPPKAQVAFRGVVRGVASGFESYPFAIVVDFTKVELRLDEEGRWRVGDVCEFRYPGFATEGASESF